MPPKFSRELYQKVIFPDAQVYQQRTSPCEVHCPAGNPIQKMHALIHEGRTEEALEYLKTRNPFPGITGRVCPHPCEAKCNRTEYDEALSIRGLERFAADRADLSLIARPKIKEKTGRKLAIVGSGPAGMTCAYFSALLGHEVTVFESAASLGGMPRLGIPGFRLPKDVVDREIGEILGLGVRARTNTTVGKDISLDEIQKSFDACLIATGTWKERGLDISGHALSLPALTFLREVNLGRRDIGKRVAIVGGGGVAFDCALTAKRLGASDIHVLCVEDKNCMCASPEDVLQAEAEGVRIHHSCAPSGVMDGGGKAAGVEYFKIASFAFDEKGVLSVEPLDGEKRVIEADTVISAVGEAPDLIFMNGWRTLALTPKKTLEVNPMTLETSAKGVFAAGDVVSGPSTVAQAIGSGRRAAMAVDAYLTGSRSEEECFKVDVDEEGFVAKEAFKGGQTPHVVTFEEILNVAYHEKKPRQSLERLSAGVSANPLEEFERGFGKEQAVAEAGRCFHCGHCTSCGCCVEDCPGFVLTMTADGPKVTFFDECWHCGCCRIACPSAAVSYEFPLNMLV